MDVDVLSDGEDVYVTGVMEHIEEAGIHSGDSAGVLPILCLIKLCVKLKTIEKTRACAESQRVDECSICSQTQC